MNKIQLTILLVHPEISRTKYNFVGVIENECLELEYISTILKEKGHTVYLYDGQIENTGIPNALKKYNPDVVYVCGRTRQESFMLEYCEDAKKYNKATEPGAWCITYGKQHYDGYIRRLKILAWRK